MMWREEKKKSNAWASCDHTQVWCERGLDTELGTFKGADWIKLVQLSADPCHIKSIRAKLLVPESLERKTACKMTLLQVVTVSQDNTHDCCMICNVKGKAGPGEQPEDKPGPTHGI